MSVELFEGTAQHKGTLGEKGGYIVATTDRNFALAFGKEVPSGAGRIKNGKMSMYRLAGVSFSSGEKQGIVSVDPRELNRVDALQYTSNHVGEIYSWDNLAQALGEQYSSQFDIETHAVNPEKRFYELDNAEQAIILRLHFGMISIEEARELIGKQETSHDGAQVFVDRLRRRLRTIKIERTKQVAGIEYSLKATIGGGIKIQDGNSVIVKYNFKENILGSKSRGRKDEKIKFTKVKKFIQEQASNASQDHVFTFDDQNISDSIDEIYSIIFGELHGQVNAIIRTVDENADFSEYGNYNRISTLSKLWKSLGLGSDVGYAGLEDNKLQEYWDKIVTAFEFANDTANDMPSRINKATLKSRLKESNVDFDAFATRIAESLKDDYKVADDEAENFVRIQKVIEEYLRDRFESIRNSVDTASTYSQSYYYYSSPNKMFTDDMETYAGAQFRDLFVDSLSDETATYISLVESSVMHVLSSNLEEAFNRFVENAHLKNVPEAIQDNIVRVSEEKAEELSAEFMSGSEKRDADSLPEEINAFMNAKGDAYFDGLIQNAYDFDAGIEAGKRVIFENVISNPTYRFVMKDYLRSALDKLVSLPLVCTLADPDQTDNFVERYMPDWENHLDQEAIEAEKRAEKVRELKENAEFNKAFEFSVRTDSRQRLEDFASQFNFEYGNVYAPLSLANDLFEARISSYLKEHVANVIVNTNPDVEMGDKFDFSSVQDVIVDEVSISTDVDGISIQSWFLSKYANTDTYKELAVETLSTLGSLIPPYRKRTKEEWKAVFADAMKTPSILMQMLSLADKGDIASAVSLVGADAQAEKEVTTLKILGGAVDTYKDYLDEKLTEEKLSQTSVLMDGDALNRLMTDVIPQAITTAFEQQREQYEVILSEGYERPTLDSKNAVEFTGVARMWIDKYVSDIFVPHANTSAKSILEDNLREVYTTTKHPENAPLLILKALEASSYHEEYSYAENHDVEGFLDKYYPEWRNGELMNYGGFMVDGQVRPELQDAYRLYKENAGIYFNTVIENKIEQDSPLAVVSKTNEGSSIVAQVLYSDWISKIREDYNDNVKQAIFDYCPNKTLEEQQAYFEGEAYKEFITPLESELTDENLDTKFLIDYKERTLGFLKKTFLRDGYLHDGLDAKYFEYFNSTAEQLKASTDATWLADYEIMSPGEFLDKYFPDLRKATEILDYDDAIKFVYAKRDAVEEIAKKIISEFNEALGIKNEPKPKAIAKVSEEAMDMFVGDFNYFYNTRETVLLEEDVEKFVESDLAALDKNVRNLYDIDTFIDDEATLEKALDMLSQTEPYNKRERSFWQERLITKVDGKFRQFLVKEDMDGLVAQYVPDWEEDKQEVTDSETYEKVMVKLNSVALTVARDTFKDKNQEILVATPYGDVSGLANMVTTNYGQEFYVEFSEYVEGKKQPLSTVVRNWGRRVVVANRISEIYEEKINKEEITKTTLAKLKEVYGDTITEDDFEKIANAQFDLPFLLEATKNFEIRKKILNQLGISAKYESGKKISRDEASEIISEVTAPLVPVYAQTRPYEWHLQERKLDNDGYYGRPKDGEEGGITATPYVNGKMIRSIIGAWYDRPDQEILFYPENKPALRENVATIFNGASKNGDFDTQIFQAIDLDVYRKREPELFESAKENYLKAYIKATAPYNKMNDEYIQTKLQRVEGNKGKEKLISYASRNESPEVWIEQYMGDWQEATQESNEDDAKDKAQDQGKSQNIVKGLTDLFNKGITRFIQNNSLPTELKMPLMQSAQALVDEHTGYVKEAMEYDEMVEEDITSIETYLVEYAQYTDEEVDSIISGMDLEKIRKDVETKLTQDLVSLGRDEKESQSLVAKLTVDEMFDFYRFNKDLSKFTQKYASRN